MNGRSVRVRRIVRASRAGRLGFVVVMAGALSSGLAGCSGHATISSTDFSAQVVKLFQDQRNVTPIVNCGTKDIDIVEGNVVHCDFSAADDPTVLYDSQTTISNVNGGDFHIDTKVDDHPKS